MDTPTPSLPSSSPGPAEVPVPVESRVATLSYAGGLVGAMTGGLQRRKLETTIARYNEKGYRLAHVLPAKTGILFHLLALVCLLVTLFLYAPQAGETLIFERRRVERPGTIVHDGGLVTYRPGVPQVGNDADPPRELDAKGVLVIVGVVAIPVVVGIAWSLAGG
ncbi:hypothetical protein HY631_04335 [Candidatus Uhrbacteria bacterium]|nr:hypothetical protein [Candidatus Uhrbacteria bacterium]